MISQVIDFSFSPNGMVHLNPSSPIEIDFDQSFWPNAEENVSTKAQYKANKNSNPKCGKKESEGKMLFSLLQWFVHTHNNTLLHQYDWQYHYWLACNTIAGCCHVAPRILSEDGCATWRRDQHGSMWIPQSSQIIGINKTNMWLSFQQCLHHAKDYFGIGGMIAFWILF